MINYYYVTESKILKKCYDVVLRSNGVDILMDVYISREQALGAIRKVWAKKELYDYITE